MRFRTWVGIIAIVTLASEGLILSANTLHPACPHGERIRMPPPFLFNGGHAYVADLPDLERLADSGDAASSPLVVCENDRLMGPAHSPHHEITESGGGRFSHWGAELLFSASDNSDPNTNGRSYQAIRTDRP